MTTPARTSKQFRVTVAVLLVLLALAPLIPRLVDDTDIQTLELEAAVEEWRSICRAEADGETRKKLRDANAPTLKPIVERAWAYARKHPEAVDSLGTLGCIIELGRVGPEFDLAVDAYIRRYVKNDGFNNFAHTLSEWLAEHSADEAEKPLRQLMAVKLERHEAGEPIFALAQVLGRTPGRIAESDQLYAEVIAQYADVEVSVGSKWSHADRARSKQFEQRKLGLGSVAPEIEGEDVDGAKFKLSDYRGRVVLLDFWGDW